MSNELKYSPNIDVRVNNLADIMPEGLLKVYPYRLINHDKDKAFLKPSTVTIAQISQAPYLMGDADTVFHNMKTDEAGGIYFELLAAATINGQLDITVATSTMAQTIKYEKTFIGLTNQFFDHVSEQPVFFTFNKPFDYEAYRNDEQPVFAAAEIIPSESSFIAGYEQTGQSLEDETLTEISFARVEVLESQYVNSKIIFITDSIPLNDPTMRVRVDGTSLVGRITANGLLNEGGDIIEDDIDMTINQKLIPFKFTPISTQDKVTMFADWFDYDVTMPELIARHFNIANGATIESLSQLKFTIAGAEQAFFNQAEINLVKDIIAVSAAFASEFSMFDRYTAEDAKNIAGIKAGDIKGDLTIAHDSQQITQGKALKVVALAGKDPQKVIDGIVETYLREYPTTENTFQWVAVKETLAAISRYIYTQYAIGKGQNAFNEVYLPWFLRPVGTVTLKKDGTNYKLDGEVSYKLYSNYMDLTTTPGDFLLPAKTNISDVKVVQTDRKLTLPEVPNVIQAIGKLPLPGDIDTRSNNDLQYIWYLPIPDDNKAKALFLNEAQTSSAGNDPVPFTTIEHPYKTGLELQPSQYANYLTDWYRRYNTLSAGTGITYNSEGTVAFRDKPIKFTVIRNGDEFKLGDIGLEHNTSGGFASNAPTWTYQWKIPVQVSYEDGSKSSVLDIPVFIHSKAWVGMGNYQEYTYTAFQNEAQAKQWIREQLIRKHIVSNEDMIADIQLVEVRSDGLYLNAPYYTNAATPYQKGAGIAFNGVTITFKEQYFDQAKVLITGMVTTTDYKRDVAYDKPKWRRMLGQLVQPAKYMWITIQDEQNFTLNEIKEVTLTTMWANSFMFDVNGHMIEIPAFNRDDETITIQRVLFY